MSKFMDSIRAYEQQMKIAKDIQTLTNNGLYGKYIPIKELKEKMGMGDSRYNIPKETPKASEELVEETIMNTEIYRRARLAVVQSQFLSGDTRTAILEAQRKQVGYGLDKYPEPLNPNTWTITETVEHIMDESIDRLHYLIMLRIKLEQQLVSGAFNDILEVRNTNSRIASISRMIDNTIEELHYLVNLCIVTDRETESEPNDSMDAIAYSLKAMAGADLDGDTIRYCEADVEATKLFADGIEFNLEKEED